MTTAVEERELLIVRKLLRTFQFEGNQGNYVENKLVNPDGPEAAAIITEAVRLLKRYRTETPLGHQPHMIAHEADALLTRAGAKQ